MVCAPEHATNLTELQSFPALRNVFRRFVPNLACIAAPLDKELQKGQQQTFEGLSDKKIKAWEKLKAKLKESPVLALQRCQGDYIVDIDPFYKQIGHVKL